MPANLTPDYERAEDKYRAASTDEARIEALREMFATIPKHKGTEKLQADIKHKLAQLRRAESKKPARGPDPFYIPRAGAGQVVLLGTPNVGKSLLVGRTTHAPVKVGDYPFTTALPVPGMAAYQDVQIELVDTPPVTAAHVPPGMWGLMRTCDVLALVVDAAADPLEETDTLLTLVAQRGLTLRSVAHDQLDPASGNEHCALLVANKIDLAPPENVATLRELYAGQLEVWPVSAETLAGVPELLARLWDMLSVVRVYTREPGKHVDTGKPFVLEKGSTVQDLAYQIHRELPDKMKFARLWRGAEVPGLHVHRTEELHDGDRVEIHQ